MSIVSAAYSQTVVWKGFSSINTASGSTDQKQIPLCSFWGNGKLNIPKGLAQDPLTYSSSFTSSSRVCVNNNFTFETRVRDSVGVTAKEHFVSLGVLTSVGFIYIALSENVNSQVQNRLYLDGVSLNNSKQDLVYDLTKWVTIKYVFNNGALSVLINGRQIANTNYTSLPSSICQMTYTLENTGDVDYVKIYDNSNGSFFYNENFYDCNNVATAQACVPKSLKIIGNSTLCSGDSLLLSSNTSATTYAWRGPKGFTSMSPNLVIPKTDSSWSGTFYLTAQFDVCTSATDSIKVTVKPSPILTLGRDTFFCNNIAYLLDAKNVGSSYKWQNGATSQYFQVKTTGNYTVTVTNASGCKSAASVKVDYTPASIVPRITIKRASCANTCDGRLRATATGGFGAPYIFKWTGGRIKDSIVDACPGDYGLTVTDSKGCAVNVVANLPSPIPIFIQTTFDTLYNSYANRCNDTKNAAIKVRATGGSGDFTFTWFTSPPQVTDYITQIGTGKIKVLATDKNNCSDTLVVDVDAPRPIEAFYKMTPPKCLGEKNGQIVLDSFAGGTFPFKFNMANAVFDAKLNGWQGLAKGTYAVFVTDANGCKAQKNFVVENPPKIAIHNTADTVIHYGDNIKLFATLDTPSVLRSISWISTNDTALLYSCRNCTTPEVNPRIPTLFKVTMTDTFGCVVMHDIIVQVDKRRPVFVPNAFSPDEDGNNDVLTVFTGNGVKKIIDFQIFNRWGQLMFTQQNVTPDLQSTGWDGNINGVKSPPDTYTWYARILFDDGETEVASGTVNLVR